MTDALVMCGGRGTRLGGEVEKPLVRVGGRPMLDRVTAALRASRVDAVYAVTSPHAPETRTRATSLDVRIVDAPGDGYVADLNHALDQVRPGADSRTGEVGVADASDGPDDPLTPVLTVAADLPLLASDPVDDALAAAGGESLSVCVPAALKRRLGASVDTSFERDLPPPNATDGDSATAPVPRELAPTGLNVVAGDAEQVWVSYDARLAVNVNRPSDVGLAESLCPPD